MHDFEGHAAQTGDEGSAGEREEEAEEEDDEDDDEDDDDSEDTVVREGDRELWEWDRERFG